MKITSVIENKAPEGLICEWGLCVHIEFEVKQYLLDTGSSDKYLKNLEPLGIHLPEVDAAVLSHAHFDHSGGYDSFFEKNQKAKLYVRAACAENCYSRHGLFRAYIGIPKGMMKRHQDRIVMVDGDYQLDEKVWLIPHKIDHPEELGKQVHMYVKVNHHFKPDGFYHEQSLVFQTSKGLVVFNSCSHGGADNIINEVLDTFPREKLYALIGGFHMKGRKEADVRAFAERLSECQVEHIYTGHCTGDKAFAILQEMLGEKVHYFETGTVLEI